MKKTFLLSLILLLSTAMFAQGGTTLLEENFDSTSMPEGWVVMENGADNWSITESNHAGGEANELRFNENPILYQQTSRMVMPKIDLTNISEVIVTFNHYIDHFQASMTMGIATSSDNGSTWNTAWSQTYYGDAREFIEQVISTPDMGKEEVLFCLFVESDSYNIYNWYFDNIKIATFNANDARLISIDNMKGIIDQGEKEISFSILNMGSQDIESFEASYEIGDITYTETFNTNVAQLETKQFTFGQSIDLLPGSYKLKVQVTKVNGGGDNNVTDNMKEMNLSIALGKTSRIPMIEHFSSSTCGPCVSVNQGMHQITNNNLGKFTYVKYPMNWPGTGDPYYTTEAYERRYYYGVTVVPHIFLDAASLGSTPVSQAQIDGSYNSDAYVNIRGAFDVEDNTINIVADVMSYVNLDNAKVYISINEKTTTGNVGSNGETEFHHIMMKMRNPEGDDYVIKAGKSQRFEFSYDMSETNVEGMDDLEVAVWVQDYDTKEIFNSRFLKEYDEHRYPARNLQMGESEDNIEITWEAPLQGNPTGYNMYVNNTLVQANTLTMTHTIDNDEEFYIIEVVALYGNETSIGVVVDNIPEVEDEESCDAPSILNANVEQDAEGFDYNFKVTFTWNPIYDANQYAIYLDGELLDKTTETSYIKGFDEEGEHYFSVATICENGESEQSEAFSFELVGVAIDEYENLFEIYPNPAENNIYIKTNEMIKEINIYNVVGVKVYSQNNNNTNHIDVSNLKDGIYFIKINAGSIQKFIKQ